MPRWTGICAALLSTGLVAMTADAGATSAPAGGAAATSGGATPASFAPASKDYSWSLTRIDSCCGLSSLETQSRQRTVVLVPTDPTDTAVKVTMLRLVLEAEHGGSTTETSRGLSFVPAHGTQLPRVAVTLPDLHPDSYSGALVLTVSSGAPDVVVPVVVATRAGPFWPFVVLVGTVALGMLVTWLAGLRAKRRLADDYARLRLRVTGLPAADAGVVVPLLEETWQSRGKDLSGAATHVAALDKGTTALVGARDARNELIDKLGTRQWPQWMQRVDRADQAVVDAVRAYAADYDTPLATLRREVGSCAEAMAVRDRVSTLQKRARVAQQHQELRTEYEKLSDDATRLVESIDGVDPDPSKPGPDVVLLLHNVEADFTVLDDAYRRLCHHPIPEPVRPAVVPSGVGARLALEPAKPTVPVSRTSNKVFDIGVRISRFAGPLVPLVVAIVVLAVGFKTSYLDNATFGASLEDWLSLAVWGIAAYGARQTLTGIAPMT